MVLSNTSNDPAIDLRQKKKTETYVKEESMILIFSETN